MAGSEEKLPDLFYFDDIMRIRVKPFMSEYFWYLTVGWTVTGLGSFYFINEWHKRKTKKL